VRRMLEQLRHHTERQTQTVLVVDPDDHRRHDLVSLLGDQRTRIVSARRYDEAAEILENRAVHCVVRDGDLRDDLDRALYDLAGRDIDGFPISLICVVRDGSSPELESRMLEAVASRPARIVNNPQELFDATAMFLHRPLLTRSTVPAGFAESGRRADPVLEGRRVLIVDDDPRNVFAISSVLEAHGMEVTFADNGRDGIDVVTTDPTIDLVLMDIMMPGMDGYATMEAIRGHGGFTDLPIIALTAKAMVGDREKAIEAGASDYVTKPVDTDVLLGVMRQWLDR